MLRYRCKRDGRIFTVTENISKYLFTTRDILKLFLLIIEFNVKYWVYWTRSLTEIDFPPKRLAVWTDDTKFQRNLFSDV